ncbi:hypothetical protein GCM10011374_11520 [Kocuria dechangensis]|uniref:Uncharacterized protein n=1 Tax=Kocuria dechangensis TaxID=1176249 RepID=A0A917GL71_9MICC|nr:hypothetical protein [Kocuria dechangensis]GGG50620.1 hypothetical protein GCM10011374_11520 [Kocuria dechangensis]
MHRSGRVLAGAVVLVATAFPLAGAHAAPADVTRGSYSGMTFTGCAGEQVSISGTYTRVRMQHADGSHEVRDQVHGTGAGSDGSPYVYRETASFGYVDYRPMEHYRRTILLVSTGPQPNLRAETTISDGVLVAAEAVCTG